MGSPVWSHDGIIAVGNAHKDKVKLTFSQGARLPDPEKLFNAGLGGNQWRAIDFLEGNKINERALKNLVRAAVDYNQIKLKRKAPAGTRAKVHKVKSDETTAGGAPVRHPAFQKALAWAEHLLSRGLLWFVQQLTGSGAAVGLVILCTRTTAFSTSGAGRAESGSRFTIEQRTSRIVTVMAGASSASPNESTPPSHSSSWKGTGRSKRTTTFGRNRRTSGLRPASRPISLTVSKAITEMVASSKIP